LKRRLEELKDRYRHGHARPRDRLHSKHGTLQVGRPANPSILDVVEGPVSFVDTRNNTRQGKVYLRPVGTVVAGVAFGRPYQSPFSVR
jgi:dihydroorotase